MGFLFMLLEMSYLPVKLRHKMERRQKAKIQLHANFKSAEWKDQIENEIDSHGPDAGLMMNMLTEANLKVPRYKPVVPLRPAPAPVAAATAPVIPNAPVQPPVLPVGAQPPVLPRGTSEEDPIDVLDGDDELFVELTLTPDQEERVRRRFTKIRSETSYSSSQ